VVFDAFPFDMATISEPARDIPIVHEAEVCILGGSCTGVFAAIRAARLGARVALVERSNCFGGVATLSLVCAWHSLWDTEGKRQIISGLTQEVMERLERRGALQVFARDNPSFGCTFNPEELKLVLDEMVLAEPNIRSFLHTDFAAPLAEGRRVEAVCVENKSGRSAIRASMFIDATGDGDLAARLGASCYRANEIQPATTCAVFSGWDTLNLVGEASYQALIQRHAAEIGFPEGYAWGCPVPGSENYMLAATRVYGVDPSDADQLTRAVFDGRRQLRSIMDILRRASPGNRLSLTALPARIGLRESRHVHCAYQLTGADVLSGRCFEDGIANGSYRVDIHHQHKPGITLRYLDGREEYHRPGFPKETARWRPESQTNPSFYQIPFRAMLPGTHGNVIVAGRMIDADPIAHAAIRVMVNMNQVGEAAGVGAFLALKTGDDAAAVSPFHLRGKLSEGGSIVI